MGTAIVNQVTVREMELKADKEKTKIIATAVVTSIGLIGLTFLASMLIQNSMAANEESEE